MDFQKRRTNLFNLLPAGSITLVFSGFELKYSADQTFLFEVNRDFYYLTGVNEDNCVLCLVKGQKECKTLLFKEETDPTLALWVGERLTLSAAGEIAKIDAVLNISKLKGYVQGLTEATRSAVFGEINSLYLNLETDFLYSDSYKFAEFAKQTLPQLTIQNVHQKIASLRMIKDNAEIKCLQKAVDVTADALVAIRKNIKSGIYEYDIEAEYNYVLKKNNTRTSFASIIGSGKNSTTLHYVVNSDKVEPNTLCVCDVGVNFQNYASDITRTYPVDGKFTARQKQIYNIVLKAQTKAMEALRPGLTWTEYNKIARDVLIDESLKIGLIKRPEEIGKYYYHSVGHFLGLDVHDTGDYTKPMEAGMYLTCEPGLYIADEKIGVRIEDDILITKDGHICLSRGIEKDPDKIEKLLENKSK